MKKIKLPAAVRKMYFTLYRKYLRSLFPSIYLPVNVYPYIQKSAASPLAALKRLNLDLKLKLRMAVVESDFLHWLILPRIQGFFCSKDCSFI